MSKVTANAQAVNLPTEELDIAHEMGPDFFKKAKEEYMARQRARAEDRLIKRGERYEQSLREKFKANKRQIALKLQLEKISEEYKALRERRKVLRAELKTLREEAKAKNKGREVAWKKDSPAAKGESKKSTSSKKGTSKGATKGQSKKASSADADDFGTVKK